jgi:hypothetical protein
LAEITEEHVARLEPLELNALSPEQKKLHDAVIGSRKRLGGPFSVLLRLGGA